MVWDFLKGDQFFGAFPPIKKKKKKNMKENVTA